MPKKMKKCKPYNNDDCYNLEKVQEDAKKVKPKDMFEGYKSNNKTKKSSKGKNTKKSKY